MKSYGQCFALLSVTAIVASAPAHAQNGTLTRSFVSSTGVDSNPCTITQPCATFAHAYTTIGANGIIAALDPGRYGPMNITGPVTINGNGWAAITAPANGSGITINADSSDNVVLKGLEIDGAGAAHNGITLNSAGSITVTDCILENFINENINSQTTGNGILLQPTSGTLAFTITNTTASNSGYAGVSYFPPSGSPSANGTIDHVVANADLYGINVNTALATGGTTVVTVSNSIASGNANSGIVIGGGVSVAPVKASIDNVTVSSNVVGITGLSSASILLGRSVITGNTDGVENGTPNTFYTYQDNRINLNGHDICVCGDGLNTTLALQ